MATTVAATIPPQAIDLIDQLSQAQAGVNQKNRLLSQARVELDEAYGRRSLIWLRCLDDPEVVQALAARTRAERLCDQGCLNQSRADRARDSAREEIDQIPRALADPANNPVEVLGRMLESQKALDQAQADFDQAVAVSSRAMASYDDLDQVIWQALDRQIDYPAIKSLIKRAHAVYDQARDRVVAAREIRDRICQEIVAAALSA